MTALILLDFVVVYDLQDKQSDSTKHHKELFKL